MKLTCLPSSCYLIHLHHLWMKIQLDKFLTQTHKHQDRIGNIVFLICKFPITISLIQDSLLSHTHITFKNHGCRHTSLFSTVRCQLSWICISTYNLFIEVYTRGASQSILPSVSKLKSAHQNSFLHMLCFAAIQQDLSMALSSHSRMAAKLVGSELIAKVAACSTAWGPGL